MDIIRKGESPTIFSDSTDVDSTGYSASLEIQSAWEQEYYPDGTPMLRVRYFIYNSNCGDYYESEWDYTGNMSYRLPVVKPTSYSIIANTHQWSKIDSAWKGIPANISFNVVVDEDKIYYAHGNCVVDPWFGDIVFNIYATRLNYEENCTVQGYRSTDNLCSEVGGNLQKDFIEFSITDGGEYLSFYEYSSGSKIGDSFMENEYNWSGIQLRYDNQYYGYSDYTATICAQVNNLIKTKSIVLNAKEPDCDEPIIICDSFEPQRLSDDKNEFIKLRANDRWSWVDQNGNDRELFIEPYNCITAQAKHPGALGVTSLNLNLIRTIDATYLVLSDLEIKACLDNRDINNPKWQFNIDNLRIPVFSDICQNANYIDLEDGNNSTLLDVNIQNYGDYRNVLDGLDYMIAGPYSQFPEYPSNYYFSQGIIAHENVHYDQIRNSVSFELDKKAFPKIRSMAKSTMDSLCPEDVASTYKYEIKNILRKNIDTGRDLEKQMELVTIESPLYETPSMIVKKGDLEADKIASEVYELVKTRFKAWAQTKAWWPK